MTEGDEPDSVFYIVSGTVKIFKGKKKRKADSSDEEESEAEEEDDDDFE